MGMIARMKRWLGPGETAVATPSPTTKPQTTVGHRPRKRPVNIDLHTNGHAQDEPASAPPPTEHLDDPDHDLAGFDTRPGPPRSRKEIIAELQRNYQEVLGIVRRVDGHLDQQGQRSVRFAEIAERVPDAIEDLGDIRRHQGRTVEAIESLAVAVREGDARLTDAQLTQIERLDELRGLMAESSQAERELIGSLIEFRDVMTSVTGATTELTSAVQRMEEREAERAGQMLRSLETTRTWLTTLAVIGGICALVALTLGIAALG